MPDRKKRDIPDRGMPASSTSIPEEAVVEVAPGESSISLAAATSAPVQAAAAPPTFGAVAFGADATAGGSVFSPSEEVAP